MITKRTLENWRKDALNCNQKHRMLESIVKSEPAVLDTATILFDELNQRIVRLTQELLDIELMKKG